MVVALRKVFSVWVVKPEGKCFELEEEEEEWMRANRRQSLAELCNPKLVRLAQVPHRTADREDSKLARRKWQPPHNIGEPQTENTLDNTFKHRNCTNGQILRSGSKLIEAGDYTSI